MVISIVRFMSDYYGVALDAGHRYSHKKLKKMFKQLKSCSFKYADSNPELVGCGKIVYVRDGYGEVFPYVCPKKVLISDKECDFTLNDNGKNRSDILEGLSEMPTYVLRELLGRYKTKPAVYRIIKNELIIRGVYEDKNYKHKKEVERLSVCDVDFKCRIRNRKSGR